MRLRYVQFCIKHFPSLSPSTDVIFSILPMTVLHRPTMLVPKWGRKLCLRHYHLFRPPRPSGLRGRPTAVVSKSCLWMQPPTVVVRWQHTPFSKNYFLAQTGAALNTMHRVYHTVMINMTTVVSSHDTSQSDSLRFCSIMASKYKTHTGRFNVVEYGNLSIVYRP